MSLVAEDVESFAASLSELTVNSKPHINMLTMLSDDSIEYAPVITQTILTHLQKVRPEVKLPVLYLIDSIVKNVGKAYINLFTASIVQSFTNTFEAVDEKTREQMFKLRQTWGEVFPSKTMFALDAKVHQIDPAWPLSPPPPTVHLNPKFFKPDLLDSKSLNSSLKHTGLSKIESRSHHRKSKSRNHSSHSSHSKKSSPPAMTVEAKPPEGHVESLREKMIRKQKMLLDLQQQKLKLELMQTQAQLEEQQKQLEKKNDKGDKPITEKLQEIVSEEQQKLQLLSNPKMMKKHLAATFPKRQEIHRATSAMKAQKVSDLSQVTGTAVESLVKPAALLELGQEELGLSVGVTPVKPILTPKESKSKILQLHQQTTALERQKATAAPTPSDESQASVRINPVSKTLLDAALSFGRNVRDPRIRQMSSRLEQLTTAPTTPAVTIPSAPTPTHTTAPSKSRRERDHRSSRSNHHKEKSSRSSEEENKHHSKPSGRSNERSVKHSVRQEKSPSKKSEERNNRKSKIDDLFSSRPSPKSPTRGHQSTKKETGHVTADVTKTEKASKVESSPKKTKASDSLHVPVCNDNDTRSGDLQPQTVPPQPQTIEKPPSLSLAFEKLAQMPKPKEEKLSPEAMDSSAEMLDEDIEKIVKNPLIIPKKDPLKNVAPVIKTKSIIVDSQALLKSDDSDESKFNDIIKKPMKQVKFANLDSVASHKEKTIATTDVDKIIRDTSSQEVKQDIIEDSIPLAPSSVQIDSLEEENKPSMTVLVNPQESLPSEEISNLVVKNDDVLPIVSHKDPRLRNLDNENRVFDNSTPPKEEINNMECEPHTTYMEQVSSTVSFPDVSHDTPDNFIHEEVVVTEPTISDTTQENISSESNVTSESNVILQKDSEECTSTTVCSVPPVESSDVKESPIENIQSPKVSQSPPLEEEQPAVETKTNTAVDVSSPKKDRKQDSPVHQEKKRKEEKPPLVEQVLEDVEKEEASPSPPPPPVITGADKFKDIKKSSLSRLRRVGRPRDDLVESPEPADVDLRLQMPPTILPKDLKNEVLGLPDKDVDLRNLAASPTKKRPSIEGPSILDVPPPKKSKGEVIDELFGSEDVDLRPKLCPQPPSPPPPPVISSSPPASGSWAHYKQSKPDAYRASKYTPSRRVDRDRVPSSDRFGRNSTSRLSVSSHEGAADVDMRVDGSCNQIFLQATEQHKRGEISDVCYKQILNDVFKLREKSKLEAAQRKDEEDTLVGDSRDLEPLSEEDISGGSLSLDDVTSPTDSYSGGDEPFHKKSDRRKGREHEPKVADVDIRVPPTDVDIRMIMKEKEMREQMKLSRRSRGESPYGRKSSEERERHRHRREEREYRRERRREKKLEEDRDLRYRNNRYTNKPWDREEHMTPPPTQEEMEVEPPRVPPLAPHFMETPAPAPRDSPPLCPPVWDPRMPVPPGPGPGPWMTPMSNTMIRGPMLGIQPPERFMPPRWRPPGPTPTPMFEGELPGPRFNRFPLPRGPPSRYPTAAPTVLCELPPTDLTVLKVIEEDPTKSINIDGAPRDIRFYGFTAVAFMTWEDPREICFQPGSRRLIIDERDSVVMHFNAPPIEIIIDGTPHRARFGGPTRELCIDHTWVEVFFGGAPVTMDIGGQPHLIKLEGPPPQVRLGPPRKDFVLGKVTLVIDAEHYFGIYLDSKPQKFEVEGAPYIIRFVEALNKTLINGVPFKSDFGGLPRPIILNGVKHYFRLTQLPAGVKPGFVSIVNMEGGRLPTPPPLPTPPQLPASLEQAMEFSTPPPDIPDAFRLPPPMLTLPPMVSPERIPSSMEAIPHPPALPPAASLPLPPVAMNSLDMLTTLMPSTEPSRAGGDYSYSVDAEGDSAPAVPTPAPTTEAPTGDINVAELLQKLMATGIVPSLEQGKNKDKTPEKSSAPVDNVLIRPVDFRKPETLKTRQSALISHLYSGIQCNSCGMRFPPEQTMKYSQHLDWHFRQNRRDKDSTRTAQSRRYYYDVSDWVQFEEIEDLEERAQPWFETQEDGGGDTEVVQPLVSVRAAEYPDDAACTICHDKLEAFYNEEKEEWQLRNALDHEGTLVHPVCLEDQRAAAEKPIVVDDIDITEDEPTESTEPKVSEGKGAGKAEEDDDIMEVTDIEYIKPVFPVEDLTVSDSEDVDDKKEESKGETETKEEENQKMDVDETSKPELSLEAVSLDETSQENKGKEGEKEEETVVDEDTQDDVVLLEKSEDSIISNTEIMEVVRNIKKDPDALGGEYDEEADTDETKREKGAVPLPAPVVDTTHTTVTCLIDGNVEFDETPQQLGVGGPPRIKINIAKPIPQMAKELPKESEELLETEPSRPPKALTPQSILENQPPPPGEEDTLLPAEVQEEEVVLKPRSVKERLQRKLQEFPLVSKDKDMSGLCSIM